MQEVNIILEEQRLATEIQYLTDEIKEYSNFCKIAPSQILTQVENKDEKTGSQISNFKNLKSRYKLLNAKILQSGFCSNLFDNFSNLVNAFSSLQKERNSVHQRELETQLEEEKLVAAEIQSLTEEMNQYSNFCKFAPSEIFAQIEDKDEKTGSQISNFKNLKSRYKLLNAKILQGGFCSNLFEIFSIMINAFSSLKKECDFAYQRKLATEMVANLSEKLAEIEKDIQESMQYFNLDESILVREYKRTPIIIKGWNWCYENPRQKMKELYERFEKQKNSEFKPSLKSQNLFHSKFFQVQDQLAELKIIISNRRSAAQGVGTIREVIQMTLYSEDSKSITRTDNKQPQSSIQLFRLGSPR